MRDAKPRGVDRAGFSTGYAAYATRLVPPGGETWPPVSKARRRARSGVQKSIMSAAKVLSAWRASSSRMSSFGAWSRLPEYATPGGSAAGVPRRV